MKAAELANLGKINTDQGFVDQLGESRRQALLDQAMRERGGIARGTSEAERIT